MCAVATEVRRAGDAKVRTAVCSTHTRFGPTKSAARRALSLGVAPARGAGGVGRLDEMSNLVFVSRLAIAPCQTGSDLAHPLFSLRKQAKKEHFSALERHFRAGFGAALPKLGGRFDRGRIAHPAAGWMRNPHPPPDLRTVLVPTMPTRSLSYTKQGQQIAVGQREGRKVPNLRPRPERAIDIRQYRTICFSLSFFERRSRDLRTARRRNRPSIAFGSDG